MDKFRITAQNLNVRAAPSITATVEFILPRGTEVERLDISGDQYWYKISHRTADRERRVGWASHKYLEPVVIPDEPGDPLWLRIALGEIGIKEFPGNQENPRIVEYLRSTTLPAPYNSQDETHWCSTFVNWCMEKAGYAGTDSAWARSWETWGQPVDPPVRGCIGVYKRPGGGHVAFYIEGDGANARILGGNQWDPGGADAVNISRKGTALELLGYRLP